MRHVHAESLTVFRARLFAAHGAPEQCAHEVARMLVRASLHGHDSHGILRFGRYIEKIRQRTLDPRAEPRIAQRHAATAVVDGGFGFGQITAKFGTDLALQLAREQGVAAVSLARCNHVGRLADYAEAIASAGCVAMIFSSGAGRGGSVAPHGGRERVFGTNPLAWALPVPAGRGPLVADFSTSAIPEGRVGLSQIAGEPVPAGTLVNADGQATTNPAAFYAGGALLPFGGHKGSSLVLFIELVASLLGGSVPCSSRDYQVGNPTMLVAIAVERFRPMEEFLKYTDELLRRIESSRATGDDARVLLPNAAELSTAAQRKTTGIPISDAMWQEFETLAREC